jgi:hypothetical protein
MGYPFLKNVFHNFEISPVYPISREHHLKFYPSLEPVHSSLYKLLIQFCVRYIVLNYADSPCLVLKIPKMNWSVITRGTDSQQLFSFHDEKNNLTEIFCLNSLIFYKFDRTKGTGTKVEVNLNFLHMFPQISFTVFRFRIRIRLAHGIGFMRKISHMRKKMADK